MWIVAVILLLLLLTALLFPLRLYFDFNGNLSRIFLGLKFFRFKKEIEKELNLFKKKNKDSSREESFDSFQESVKPESVSSIKSKANVEKKEPIKSERDLSVSDVKSSKEEKKDSKINSEEKDDFFEDKVSSSGEESVESKEFLERDFFSVLLQPSFVSSAWGTGISVLQKLFHLCDVKFKDSYITGIRGRMPADTGMFAAIAANLKGVFPHLDGWNLELDWCGNTPFSINCHAVLKTNILRILWVLFYAAIHALKLYVSYRLLKRRYLKAKETMPLSWWRNKVVNFLAEE